MGRITFREAVKGSQHWIQRAVNLFPKTLNKSITDKLDDATIEWLSPLKKDEYAEYKDRHFLDKLGVDLQELKLSDFWPTRGGPQWDALGKTEKGQILLVEAKSHQSEIVSTGTRAKYSSRERIYRSLQEVKTYLGVENEVDWSKVYYQYTNRIAHLYLLKRNKIDAYLVFVYFMNDKEMKGPKSVSEWKEAINKMKSSLGIKENKLDKFIIESFIDVKELA